MLQPTTIDEARSLLAKGRYAQAEDVLLRLGPTDERFGEASLLVVDSLVKRGKVSAAIRYLQTIERSGLSCEQSESVRLWLVCLRFQASLPDIDPLVLTQLDDPVCETNTSLAKDLRARMRIMLVTMIGGNEADKADVMAVADQARDFYLASGDYARAARVELRSARFLAAVPFPNVSGALLRLSRCLELPQSSSLPLEAAELSLETAKLRFIDGHMGLLEPNLTELLASFDGARLLFEAAAYEPGLATVQAALARLLLEYAYEDGVRLAEDAVKSLDEYDLAGDSLGLLHELHVWHVRHGNGQEAVRLQDEIGARFHEPGERASGLSTSLAAADFNLREGNIAKALEQAALAGADPLRVNHEGVTAGTWIIRSVILERAGRTQDALAVLETLGRSLSDGRNPFYADVLSRLAHMYSNSDPARAKVFFDRAVREWLRRGEPVAAARLLIQGARARALHRHGSGHPDVLTEDVQADFDAALQTLALQRTHLAKLERANLASIRGQLGHITRDWAACATWLDEAERLYSDLGHQFELGNTKVQQGLALMSLARAGSPEAYRSAAECFKEGAETYQRCGLRSLFGQSRFHQGLCEMEAALAEEAGSAERAQRATLSRRYLEEASEHIDEMRETVVPSAEEAAAYGIVSSFNADKREVFATGLSLALDVMDDPAEALVWIERMKSRALLFQMGARDRPASGAKADADRAPRLSAVPRWQDLRLALREQAPGTLLVSYFVGKRSVLAIGMRGDWDRPESAWVDVDPQELAALRLSMQRPGGIRTKFEDEGEGPWQRFHPLIDPVERWSNEGDHVCIVPFGDLHGLPLSVLRFRGDRERLLFRNLVTFSPSAAVLASLLRRPPTRMASALRSAAVFGDPADDRPRSREEALFVARVAGVPPRIGGQVTRDSMLRALRDVRFLHYAGHANASSGRALDNCLELADGDLLSAQDLMLEDLGVRVAVLSGCESGAGEVAPGDEFVGLPLALLIGGVRTLIASGWRINDGSSQAFMQEFYGNLGKGPALALQQAARAVEAHAKWRSPYHWGAFTLLGDWR